MSENQSVAIMQPYLFPYIGYYQLINKVDYFVILDNVNYMKKGWINRNRLLINGLPSFFCLPIKEVSQNKKINELYFDNFLFNKNKLLKTIYYTYSKASEFELIYNLFSIILSFENSKVVDFIEFTLTQIAKHFEFKTNFILSSKFDIEHSSKEDFIINLVKKFNVNNYINLPNGLSLYDKNYFKTKDINLLFIERNFNLQYNQFNDSFCKDLSIIDCMMFNNSKNMNMLLNQFRIF